MKLSFRTKLILAMTLIVTGVTVATMWATQKRVRATYQHLFEEQFLLQINYFSEHRIEELHAEAAKCETVTKNIRVSAALEEYASGGDPNRVYEDVEQIFSDLNRTPEAVSATMQKIANALARGAKGPPGQKGEKGPMPLMRGRDRFFGGVPRVTVLDQSGQTIEATKQGAVLKRPMVGEDQRPSERIFMNRKPGDLKDQEVGYLAAENDSRPPDTREHEGRDGERGKRGDEKKPQEPREKRMELREFIVTPIVNQALDSPETVGALVVSFPVRDFGERAMSDFSEKALKSGIWLDGKIYSETIDPSARHDVSERIAASYKDTDAKGTVKQMIELNGVPHLLFFKVLNPDSIFPPAAQVCLYSMHEAVDEQAASRQQILGFGSLALLVGVGCILYISKGFSKPIEQLVEGTRRVQEGDFSVKVNVRSRDELGTLADSFNAMTAELALKERYKTVLAQVTDKEVAEQLISGQMSLGGEVKQVSVLFCDIRGFTALTENMPPAEVITMLNEHMTAMNRVVYKHYGVVDKFVGDLVMAVFGAPKSYGNDALHAVRCALKMIEERKRLNENTRYSFEIGIGVATGEVVAGCMGSEDRLNYTVLGERVNLASRLCSKAGRTELLIDETTHNLLPPGIVAEPTEPLPLKGFSAPVPAYHLIEMNGVPFTEAELDPVPA